MKYKVKNISSDRRIFWVEKSSKIYNLESGEEVIVNSKPKGMSKNFEYKKVEPRKRRPKKIEINTEKLNPEEDTSEENRNKPLEENNYGK